MQDARDERVRKVCVTHIRVALATNAAEPSQPNEAPRLGLALADAAATHNAGETAGSLLDRKDCITRRRQGGVREGRESTAELCRLRRHYDLFR
mgnify:CR=1 FL=1